MVPQSMCHCGYPEEKQHGRQIHRSQSLSLPPSPPGLVSVQQTTLMCTLEPAPGEVARPQGRAPFQAEVGRTRWGQSPPPSRWHGLGRNGAAVWVCKLMSWRAWKRQDSPGPICGPICQLFRQQWGEFCQELRSVKHVNQHGFPMWSRSRDHGTHFRCL